MKKYIFFFVCITYLYTFISVPQETGQKYYDGHILDELSRRPLEDEDSLLYEQYLREERLSESTLADSNLTLVGEWPWKQCYAVAVRDSYALIGNGKLIQVMDISDPSNPTVAAEYNTGGLVRDIQLRDTLAFVCTRGGLQILDISDLFNPREISFLSLIATRQVIPTDSFAYVLGNPGVNPRVFVIDISDLANPYIRSSILTIADWPVYIGVSNRFIYATGINFPYLTIIDARNPDSLIGVALGGVWSNAICVRDTFLYLGMGGMLAVFSISNPIEPFLLDTIYSGTELEMRAITVEGNYAYASHDSSLCIYDITNPYDVFFVSRLKTIRGRSLKIKDSVVHIATRTGYNIINVANIDSMHEVGKFYTGGRPNDIAIQGHYAYVATGRPGLTILDLSNPIAPVRVGVLDFGATSYSIAVKNSFAYIGADGFWTVDISNPRALKTTSYTPSEVYWTQDIVVNKNRAYILEKELAIFNITNPSKPENKVYYIIPHPSFRLDVKDSLLFVISEDSGSSVLIVLNVYDVSNIFEVYRSPFSARGICVEDTIAYVADDYGLTILNISKPGFPILSSITTPGSRSIVDMTHLGKYLYMSYGTMVIVDVSDPLSPKVVGRGGGNVRIEAYDKYIYLCGEIFLTIIRNELITSVKDSPLYPTENKLFQNYPNPFNSSTSIKFCVKEYGLTTIKIFNIVAQEIATIFEEYTTPGYYTITWNTDNIPSGIYFYRFKTKSYWENKRGILIK
ncbi:MAG: T9SS type A sorting domain-containing protein [Bacteroidota bacterium]|nr:T9SS type A sorting domain-containing protein [Bacteroidota bacterium]